MLEQQRGELILDEGTRLVVYDDATGQPIRPGDHVIGHPSIGIGRALDVHGVTQAEARYLFVNDILQVESELAAQAFFQKLDPVRQGVLVNLAFNLGIHGLMTFTRMLDAMGHQNWEVAAAELRNSRWANQVQRSRRDRLIEQLRTGSLAVAAPALSPHEQLNEAELNRIRGPRP